MTDQDPDDREAAQMVDGMPESALPHDLVRALDWLRAHLSEPIDLERLAQIAGVRPRTLEVHFRTFLNTTPLGWVRRVRLTRARRELERARAEHTVTDIALASGFMQLGRFATQYHAAFGEAPSATLRRAQRSGSGKFDAVDDEALRLTCEALPRVFAVAPRECSEALESLDDAQRLAPHHGLPVAAAAWCWGQRAAHGFSGARRDVSDQACELASQACALAPHDAMTLTLASGAFTLAHRLREADDVIERALALDPWLPFAWIRRGWTSAYLGDPDAAARDLAVALRMMPMGPLSPLAFVGMGCAHFAAGRYEQAARWIQSGTEAFAGTFWADRIAVAAAVHAGACAEAQRIARRLLRNDPDLTVERARSAWPFQPGFMARLGDGLDRAGVPRH